MSLAKKKIAYAIVHSNLCSRALNFFSVYHVRKHISKLYPQMINPLSHLKPSKSKSSGWWCGLCNHQALIEVFPLQQYFRTMQKI